MRSPLRPAAPALLLLLLLPVCWAYSVVEPLPEQEVVDAAPGNASSCESLTFEEWLEIQPEPVHVDQIPGGRQPDEAIVVMDYVEPTTVTDDDYDPSDSESTDDDHSLLHDGDNSHDDEHVGYSNDVNDIGSHEDDDPDYRVKRSLDTDEYDDDDDDNDRRKKRSVSSEEDSDEQTDSTFIFEENTLNDTEVDLIETHSNGGEVSTRNDDDSDEHNDTQGSDEDNSEEDEDKPLAMLKLKLRRAAGQMLPPGAVTQVKLKNYQRARMHFFIIVEPYDGNTCSNGSFATEHQFFKSRRCLHCHDHESHHGHDASHTHGHDASHTHGHDASHTHGHDANHTHGHEDAHDRHDHHGARHRRHSYNLRSGSQRNSSFETNDTVDIDDNLNATSSSESVAEDTTVVNIAQHHLRQPLQAAEGQATTCGSTVDGWIDAQSKVEMEYTAPACGCFVIRAYVSFLISNGSLVLTSKGNSKFLEHFDCIQPNSTPEDDEDYEDYEDRTNEIFDDTVDMDGMDPANIIDEEDVDHHHADDHEDEEDDEEDSFTHRRGQEGYDLRPRRQGIQYGADEFLDESDESDENYAPQFEHLRKNRRRYRRTSTDETVHDEASSRVDRRQHRQHMKQTRREERREARQHRRRGHNRVEPSSAPDEELNGLPSPEDSSDNSLDDPRHVRRLIKSRRRHHRRQRGRAQVGPNSSGSVTESPLEGSNALVDGHGRGGRWNRQHSRRNSEGMTLNRLLVREMNNTGSKFCCKQGIQHKKASTFPQDDGTYSEVNCALVPPEVPIWANHKHAIDNSVCQEYYNDCCQKFNLSVWQTWRQGATERREARKERRRARHH